MSRETLYRLSEFNAISVPVFSPTRQEFAAIGSTGTLGIFETSSGKQIAQIQLDPLRIDRRDYVCEYSVDGKYLVCGGDIGRMCVIDSENHHIVSQHQIPEKFCSVAFDPLNRFFVSGHFDGTLRIWNWPTCTLRSTMKIADNVVRKVLITPDGNTLIAACVGSIRLWSLRHEVEYGTLFSDGTHAYSISLSADGKTLYAVVLDPSDNRSTLLIYSTDMPPSMKVHEINRINP